MLKPLNDLQEEVKESKQSVIPYPSFKTKLRRTKLLLIYRYLLKHYFSYKYQTKNNWIIQTSSTTNFNRHPDLFKFSQRFFCNSSEIKVLSFGCSNGFECFSLRCYFPDASIIGCDINKDSLECANNMNNDKKIDFVFSNEQNISDYGPYDLIFALSVLCKEPEGNIVKDLSKTFPFCTFENIINVLDYNLKVGGLLIIRNSNYLFEDTLNYYHYKILKKTKSIFPQFNISGIKNNEIIERGEIFEKIS